MGLIKKCIFTINLHCLKRLQWNRMKFGQISLITVTCLVFKYHVTLSRDYGLRAVNNKEKIGDFTWEMGTLFFHSLKN